MFIELHVGTGITIFYCMCPSARIHFVCKRSSILFFARLCQIVMVHVIGCWKPNGWSLNSHNALIYKHSFHCLKIFTLHKKVKKKPPIFIWYSTVVLFYHRLNYVVFYKGVSLYRCKFVKYTWDLHTL